MLILLLFMHFPFHNQVESLINASLSLANTAWYSMNLLRFLFPADSLFEKLFKKIKNQVQ